MFERLKKREKGRQSMNMDEAQAGWESGSQGGRQRVRENGRPR